MRMSRTLSLAATALVVAVSSAAPAQAGRVFYTESATGRDAEIVDWRGPQRERTVTVRWREPWGDVHGTTRHSVSCSGMTVVNHNLSWSPAYVFEITPGAYAAPGAENFSYDLFYTVCEGNPDAY